MVRIGGGGFNPLVLEAKWVPNRPKPSQSVALQTTKRGSLLLFRPGAGVSCCFFLVAPTPPRPTHPTHPPQGRTNSTPPNPGPCLLPSELEALRGARLGALGPWGHGSREGLRSGSAGLPWEALCVPISWGEGGRDLDFFGLLGGGGRFFRFGGGGGWGGKASLPLGANVGDAHSCMRARPVYVGPLMGFLQTVGCNTSSTRPHAAGFRVSANRTRSVAWNIPQSNEQDIHSNRGTEAIVRERSGPPRPVLVPKLARGPIAHLSQCFFFTEACQEFHERSWVWAPNLLTRSLSNSGSKRQWKPFAPAFASHQQSERPPESCPRCPLPTSWCPLRKRPATDWSSQRWLSHGNHILWLFPFAFLKGPEFYFHGRSAPSFLRFGAPAAPKPAALRCSDPGVSRKPQAMWARRIGAPDRCPSQTRAPWQDLGFVFSFFSAPLTGTSPGRPHQWYHSSQFPKFVLAGSVACIASAITRCC